MLLLTSITLTIYKESNCKLIITRDYVQLEFYNKNGGEVLMKVLALKNNVKQVYVNKLF